MRPGTPVRGRRSASTSGRRPRLRQQRSSRRRSEEEPPAEVARAVGQTYRALARRVEFQRTGL
eukprot:4761877-Pyramimonas_sp.AAC.1